MWYSRIICFLLSSNKILRQNSSCLPDKEILVHNNAREMEAFKAYYSRIVLVPQTQSPVEWVRSSHPLFFLMIIHCYPFIEAISCIYLSISFFPPITLIFTLEFSSAYSSPMWSGKDVAQWLGKRWVFDPNYCLTLLIVKGRSGNEEIGIWCFVWALEQLHLKPQNSVMN